MPDDTPIKPIPTDRQAHRSWRVEIDGKTVSPVSHLRLTSPQFGTVSYGQTPGGYDSWSYAEPLGGVVIVPFIATPDGPLIGLLDEYRPNLGGWTQNLPRGFVDAGESNESAALREFREETGHPLTHCDALPGGLANPNSAFWTTPGNDQGIAFFAAEIARADTLERDGALVLARTPPSQGSAGAEQTRALRFVPWRQAVLVRDMFTLAGVARLLAWFARKEG